MQKTCGIFLVAFLAILASPAISQERISPELSNFLIFVEDNYWNSMSSADYNRLHPLDWAWILGAAFEREWQWALTVHDRRVRANKRRYLELLWQELNDYVTEASARYRQSGITAAQLRDELRFGYLRYDPEGNLSGYVRRLGLDRPIPEVPLKYGTGYPQGGRLMVADTYSQPWDRAKGENGRVVAGGSPPDISIPEDTLIPNIPEKEK